MNVLCVCPIGIGNYLLFYPACAALKHRCPDYRLHLLGLREGIRAYAQDDPVWSGVHVFDPTRLKGGPGTRLAVIQSLRRCRFDAALLFFPSNKWMYHLLPVLSGIRHRWGFHYHYRPLHTLGFLLTNTLSVDTACHDARQNMRLTCAFSGHRGDPVDTGSYTWPTLVTDDDIAWARGYLADIGVDRCVAVHPGSSAEHGMDAKRWQVERFARLCDRIAETWNTVTLIMGGPEEQDLKQRMAATMHHRNAVPATPSLRKTAALLSLCSLSVCNDSGLMHIAAVMGVPTIGIFGPTDERRNGPLGPHTLVVRKEMPGFPVWTAENVGTRRVKSGVDPRASLQALTVEDAWQQCHAFCETHLAE